MGALFGSNKMNTGILHRNTAGNHCYMYIPPSPPANGRAASLMDMGAISAMSSRDKKNFFEQVEVAWFCHRCYFLLAFFFVALGFGVGFDPSAFFLRFASLAPCVDGS